MTVPPSKTDGGLSAPEAAVPLLRLRVAPGLAEPDVATVEDKAARAVHTVTADFLEVFVQFDGEPVLEVGAEIGVPISALDGLNAELSEAFSSK